ncbi:Beta-lactamase-like [Mycobacteroides abscessus subsp. abscessus]|nr:Beta-lactamase-like [Mycobacteroides abscessus subsp. abscessus]
MDENTPDIELIVTTHQHFDHWQALEAIVGKTQSPSAAHDLDAGPLPVRPNTLLAGGDSLDIGDLHFEFTSLMDDLEGRVFGRYPDDTVVYPGHGDDTTLGSERPHLAEWRERGW